jgi:hypothetical protein
MSAVPNGLGPMARTGDQTKALIAAGGASGNLAILDYNGKVLTGPIAIGAGTIPVVAANPDGSRFAALISNGAAQIILLDGALSQNCHATVGRHSGTSVFSRWNVVVCQSDGGNVPGNSGLQRPDSANHRPGSRRRIFPLTCRGGARSASCLKISVRPPTLHPFL